MTLRAELSDMATRLPGPYRRADEELGPHQAQARYKAASTAEKKDIEAILEDFLENGTAAEASLAGWTSWTIPLSPKAMAAGLTRSDLDDDAAAKLRFHLGKAVAQGEVAYDTAFRAHASRKSGETMAAAVFIHDHTWAMNHLKDLLGAAEDDAITTYSTVSQQLNAAEAKAARAELEAKRDDLGDDYVKALCETSEYYEKQGSLEGPGTKVRWA